MHTQHINSCQFSDTTIGVNIVTHYSLCTSFYTYTHADLFQSSEYPLPIWSNLWYKCFSTTSLSDIPACCSRICCDTQLMASGQQFCQWMWLCILVAGYVVAYRNFQSLCIFLLPQFPLCDTTIGVNIVTHYSLCTSFYTYTHADLFQSSEYPLPIWSNLWYKCFSTTSLSDIPACCSRICCDTQLMASGQQFCQWMWLCILVAGYVVAYRNFQSLCIFLLPQFPLFRYC